MYYDKFLVWDVCKKIAGILGNGLILLGLCLPVVNRGTEYGTYTVREMAMFSFRYESVFLWIAVVFLLLAILFLLKKHFTRSFVFTLLATIPVWVTVIMTMVQEKNGVCHPAAGFYVALVGLLFAVASFVAEQADRKKEKMELQAEQSADSTEA